MNKKLLAVLTTALVLGLAACGGKPAHPTEGYTVFGQFMVGEVANGWGDKSTEVYDATLMTKLDVENLEGDSATLLDGKPVSEAYVISNVLLGTTDAGWSASAMKDNAKVSCNGSFAIKAGYATYDAEDAIWAVGTWIPDPHVTHVENLTADDLFIPTWTEESDENGFSWADNPVALAGPGSYTVLLAKYTTSAGEDSYNYGMALLLDEELTSEYGEYTEVTEFVPADHTFGLVGTINTWGGTADIAMVGNEDSSSFTVDYTFAVDDEWKIRIDSAWVTPDWGFAAVVSQPEGAFVDAGGNIKCAIAGEYTITLDNFAVDGSADITIEEKAVVNPLAAVYEAAVGAAVEFDGIYLGKYGTLTSDVYVGNGDLAVDVYNYSGVTLPEGIEVGDKVHVVGVAAAYKGLVEVTPTTITLAPEAVVAEVTPIALDGTWNKLMLSRPATLTGTVKNAVAAMDGSANVTAVVTVGSVDVNVYIKKSAGLDYAGLSAAFATAGAAISLKGFVAIYDGAATVDYATSTGYQLVNPSVVVA